MSDLPTGTVTLLFTDIEGSTQLLKALGDEYEQVLSDHRALLRRAFNLFGGDVVDRQGDAFFVVFRRAKDAVAGALNAQRALSAHPWPKDSRVRVRMGIHTGEPSVGHEGLTGFPVHVAARICAAAHGGQVLVSSTTRDLVEDRLPAGSVLRDLGEHVLKDVDRPARLFQLVAEGLEDSFPPLRTDAGDVSVTSLAPEEGKRATLAASHDPRPKSPLSASALRPRRPLREAVRRRLARAALDQVGARIYSMARLSPSPELGDALRALGGAILQAARYDRRADDVLKSIDRRAVERRLSDLRHADFLSEREARLADGLAIEVDALKRIVDLKSALRADVARIEARTNEIRQEIFVARLGDPLSGDLVTEMTEFCESVQSLGRQLQQVEREAERLAELSKRLGSGRGAV